MFRWLTHAKRVPAFVILGMYECAVSTRLFDSFKFSLWNRITSNFSLKDYGWKVMADEPGYLTVPLISRLPGTGFEYSDTGSRLGHIHGCVIQWLLHVGLMTF